MEWIWWVVAAFFGGGFLGILVAALMYMAADAPKPSTHGLPDLDVTR
jgi:hypothetical protein